MYHDIWDALIRELPCHKKADKSVDPFTVAVIKSRNIVDHVPRKISTLRSLLLQRGGMISCLVTKSRHYLRDLPQGRVEIHCKLVFCGEKEYVSKARKILDQILSASESASPRGTTGNPAQSRADDMNKVVFVENLEVKCTVKSEKMNPSEFEAES